MVFELKTVSGGARETRAPYSLTVFDSECILGYQCDQHLFSSLLKVTPMLPVQVKYRQYLDLLAGIGVGSGLVFDLLVGYCQLLLRSQDSGGITNFRKPCTAP